MKRYLLFYLAIILAIFLWPATAVARDKIDEVQISILEGDYSQAVKLGESLLASFREKRPPKEVYVYLCIAYRELNYKRRAGDIFDILVKEYGLSDTERTFLKSCLVSSNPNHFYRQTKQDDNWLFLQVGAFRSEANAHKFEVRLYGRGFRTEIRFDKQMGLYKVLVLSRPGSLDYTIERLNKYGIKFRRIE